MPEKNEDYRLAAIMFTDIYGFSRMMENNERRMLALLAEHNGIIQGLVTQYGGHVIKTIGDAFLVDFNNSVRAVECAVEIQKAFTNFNQEREKDTKIFLRIGVHLGDIWFFENDALGEGINIAARLQGLAKPGRIVISHDVYNQVYNKLDVEIFSLGKAKLKNITKEITAYEIPTEASGEFSQYHPEVMDFHDEKSQIETPAEVEKQIEKAAASPVMPESVTTSEPKAMTAEPVPVNLAVVENPSEAQLLERLKAAGTRLPVEQIAGFFGHATKGFMDHALSKLAEEGVITRIETPDGGTQYGMGDFRFESKKPVKKSIRELIRRRMMRLRGDMFGIVPAILFTGIAWIVFSWINGHFTPDVKWVNPVMIALLAGLAGNFLRGFCAVRQIGELRRAPEDVTEEQWILLRRAQKADRGFFSHLRTWLSFSGMFFLLNALTSAAFLKTVAASKAIGWVMKNPVVVSILKNESYRYWTARFPDWWMILAAAWGIFVLFHFFAAGGSILRLRTELRATGYRGRSRRHEMRVEFAGVDDDD